MTNTHITLGSDPEIFVENKEGRIVSGINIIPGTKEEPHPISESGHYIQVDNIAWEFNIPASQNKKEFNDNIEYVLNHLNEIAQTNELQLSKKSSDIIEPQELTHPDALRFGCEPDLNAYTMMDNESPDINTQLRCVGGHVHIGYPNPSVETSIRIVKIFDLLVTLPAALKDDDVRRRELYGKPGSFRFKDFGLECRALSNFWIHDQENREWVYEQTIKAAQIAIDNENLAESLITNYSELAVEAINSYNKIAISDLYKTITNALIPA